MVALIAFVGYGIGFKLLKDVSWTGAVVLGAVGGLTVSAATVLALGLRKRELRAVKADQMLPARQAEAYRAAQRGQVHPDPEIRAAALRIADHRLKGASRQRKVFIVTAALLAVSTTLSLIEGRVFSAVLGVAGVVAFGVLLLQLRTVHRRAAELLGTSGGPSSVDRPGNNSG